MKFVRIFRALGIGAALFAATPASAQFYLKSPDRAGARISGTEPGMLGDPLTGASPAELRAAMVWNLRAALNVAALQCQFAPTLLTLPNYNTLLRDHQAEFLSSYTTLAGYFNRQGRTPREGQQLLDRYGTRVYSGYSTVGAQLSFCRTAGTVGNDALFTSRGALADFAADRLRELRNSLTPAYEMQFPRTYHVLMATPQFNNPRCWRGGEYRPERCRR